MNTEEHEVSPIKDRARSNRSQSSQSTVPTITHSQIETMSGKTGWKSILLLQFQTQFQLAVYMGIIFSYVMVARDSSMALGTERDNISTKYVTSTKSIIYAFDVFYFIDLLLMIIFKNTSWPEVRHLYKSRNGVIIFIECFTLVPLDAIYYSVSKNTRMNVVYYLRLRYALRLIRVIDTQKQLRKIDKRENLLKLMITFFVVLYMGIVTLTCLVYPFSLDTKSHFHDMSLYFVAMYVAAEKLTSKGFGEVRRHTLQSDYLLYGLSVVNFFSNILLGYYTSKLVCNLINNHTTLFNFLESYMGLKKTILTWKHHHMVVMSTAWKKKHGLLFSTFTAFFEFLWRNRRGVKPRMLSKKIIPMVMYRDIALDMSWDAFKHSHLFRNEESHLLRHLASHVDHVFFVPGEIICQSHEMRSGMLYIVNGIVQIFSEENGETPILSLSGGTCIGESTLIIDYPSTCTLISKTYSEITMLKRGNFTKLSKMYPRTFRKFVSVITDRYRTSKEFSELIKFQRVEKDLQDYNLLTMIWLKRTLYSFIDKNRSYGKDILLQNKLNKSVFCATYLDMLTLTEKLELVSDTVFVKKQFPCIFQPTSVFIDGWNIFVTCIVWVFAALYPWYLCNSKALSTIDHMFIFGSLTLVYIIDVYFLMSTAVKTKDSFLSDISTIIYYRLTKFTYVIDLFAIVPFSLIIWTMNGNSNPEALILSEFHKLLKIYKSKFLFSKLENLKLFNIVVLKYVKVLLFSFLVLYYTSGLFYYLACSESGCPNAYSRMLYSYLDIVDHWNKWKQFVQMYAMSSFFSADITNFDYLRLIPPTKYHIIVFIQMTYTFFYIYMLAMAAIVETLKERKHHMYREFVSSMETLIKDFEMSGNIRDRIRFYLKTSYYLNSGFNFLYPTLCSQIMSQRLFSTFRQTMYADFLKSVPLFQNIDNRNLIEISKSLKISNFPRGEVITYAGEVCKEMHFIEFGYCRIHSAHEQLLKAEDSFCVLETFLKIPVFYTVTTVTDCKILSLGYEKLVTIMSHYPNFKQDVTTALNMTTEHDHLKRVQVEIQNMSQIDFIVEHDENADSFRRFVCKIKRVTKNDRRYHKVIYLYLFKYLLLRRTITPFGKFMFYWEISRCIFAFTTNILTAFTNMDLNIFYFLVFFDVTAWIDIYVRHHVCYFNQMGIEVNHPMYTAIYYWKHGFLLDVIGAAPIDYQSSKLLMYLRMNRLIQIHRIFGFIRFMNRNNISKSNLYNMSKYIPLTLLLVNYVSCLHLHITCEFDEEILSQPTWRISCSTEFWLKNATIPYNKISAHIACLLLTTACLSCIGFTPIKLRQPQELYINSCMILIGQVFFIWLTARIIADNFYRKTDLTEYQEAMRIMLNFLNYRKIDRVIKKEVIDYFEYMWEKTKAKNLNKLLFSFNTAFKEDILYDIFGRAIQTSTIFPNASKSFFKSLLLSVKYEVYISRAVIYRVNDVHGNIFIILKGRVEILGPDYNRLLVLASGSLFGNLDDYPLSRQTLMMVAKGHVELLKIDSKCFHSILLQYPRLHAHFNRLTAYNVDYLENYYMWEEELHRERSLPIVKERPARWNSFMKLTKFYLRITRVYSQSQATNCWNIVMIVFVCYFGFHLELYQKSQGQVSYLLCCVLYLCDILYLCRIYMKFHTTYMNEFGVEIKSRSLIAKQYLTKSLGFYFDLAAVMPIEMISLIFINHVYFWNIWTWCRVNRLIRIALVLNILMANKERLNINVIVMRILYLICWVSLVIQVMTNVLYFFRLSISDAKTGYDRIKLLTTTYVIIIYTASGAALTNISMKFDQKIMICVVLIILVSRFFMSMVIAVMCTSLEAINQSKTIYQQFASHMKYFMLQESVSVPLRREISEYINLLWSYHKGVQFPKLLHEAPYYLREAVMSALFGYHLRKHPVIKQCHVDLVRQMAAELQTMIFFPGNYIAYEGDIDGCMYFIHKGEVNALSDDSIYSEVVHKTLYAGDVFGFKQGIYLRRGQAYTYKANRYSVLVVLERTKWIHLLDFFPASKSIIYDKTEEQLLY